MNIKEILISNLGFSSFFSIIIIFTIKQVIEKKLNLHYKNIEKSFDIKFEKYIICSSEVYSLLDEFNDILNSIKLILAANMLDYESSLYKFSKINDIYNDISLYYKKNKLTLLKVIEEDYNLIVYNYEKFKDFSDDYTLNKCSLAKENIDEFIFGIESLQQSIINVSNNLKLYYNQ